MSKLGYTWYPKDFISDPDVMFMTSSERGVYRDIIDLAYMSENMIKYSIDMLARYTNSDVETVQKVLDMKGEKSGDFWTIPSCDKRIELAEKNRINGAKGGRPKTQTKPKQNPDLTQTEPKAKGKEKEKEKENNNTDANAPDGVTFSSRCSKFIAHFNNLKGDKVNADNKPTGYRINDKVKRSLKARIKDGYSADDISTALTNALQDSYHVETNGKYITPEFILRADKLEKYLNSPISKKPAEQDDYLERLPEDRRQAYLMAKLHGA